MKKLLFIGGLIAINHLGAQFKINIEAPANFESKEVYIYTLDGSKDKLYSKETRKGNSWQINFNEPYMGMLKAYFPEVNASMNFISENKDVKMVLNTDNRKIDNINYLDESNNLMNGLQDTQQKKEYILPALYQIKDYYKGKSAFGSALEEEISRLSKTQVSLDKYPFINFYNQNYGRFIEKNASKKPLTHEEISNFLSQSSNLLESSSLLRPILVAYLNIGPSNNVSADVDKLIAATGTNTSRGQTILAELIEIFDMYSMQELKEKYLATAESLKKPVNERLLATITKNNGTKVGATFANYFFVRPANTTAKSIYDVKADKKVVVFWASTCSHCESELPEIAKKYSLLKSKGVEVIAFSLDNEKDAYEKKIKDFPWINDSELKGWYSSTADIYNVQSTPTYFILDSSNKVIAKPDHAADVLSYFKVN